jgi:hypothetical protein
MKRRGTPQEQADPFDVLLGDLVKTVAGGKTGTEKVFGLQQGVKALAFGGVGEHAHGQRAVGVRREFRANRFHPSLLCARKA